MTAVLALKRPSIFESAEKEATSAITTEQVVATSCLNCSTRCATLVRVVNGKAVRITGNPASLYSDGKTCPRSHVGLQVLYNPDRFVTPLQRKPGTTKGRGTSMDDFEAISWDDALANMVQRLQGTSPNRLLILEGLNPTSDEDLIDEFARAYGTANVFREEDLEIAAEREGRKLADGRDNSGYELESLDGTATRYILAFGAGIVESERPLARNLRMWGKLRRESANRTKIVALEPRYSVTAAKADEWIPLNPGTEGALAMAIANVIITEDLYDQEFVSNWSSGFDNYSTLVTSPGFTPENVAQLTGVSAEVIRTVAREFARTRPAIAWGGEAATSWPYGSYASHAIYCLNALVGSIDVPGGIVYQEYPDYNPMPPPPSSTVEPGISFRRTEELMSNQTVDVVVGFQSNLIMSVPSAAKWESALKSLPYYVHVGPAMTEMAAYADIILPASTFLEEWGYESALPSSGYAESRIKQPVISEPRFESRSVARILFEMASRMGPPVATSFTDITADPGSFAEEFVKYRTGSFVSWDEFRSSGVWEGGPYQYEKYDEIFHTPSGKFEFKADHLESLLDVKLPGEDTEYPLMLGIYRPVLEIRSGSQNYPWAQEVFLVMQGRGWGNTVEVSPDSAREWGIGDGDRVVVQSVFGDLEAQAKVIEGIRPGVIAIAEGEGHWWSGRFADGLGVNPNDIMVTAYDEETGQPSYFSTRVRIRRA